MILFHGGEEMKARVVNCKELGIRKTPWIPQDKPEIITTIPQGEIVEVKSLAKVYDWTGRRFYRIETQTGIEGYGIVDALEFL
jgi:hypothetical protein